MNSYNSGLIGRLVFSKKSTILYNVLWCLVIVVMLFAFFMTFQQYMCDSNTYEAISTYKSFDEGHLEFDSLKFELPKENSQNIKIDVLLSKVAHNDKVRLKISTISGDLIEAYYYDEIVYQKSTVTKTLIIFVAIFCVLVIIFCVLMLIATNIKKPKCKIFRKLNRSLYFGR